MKKFSLYILISICLLFYTVGLQSQINKSVISEVKSNIFELNFAKADSSIQSIHQLSLKSYLNLYNAFVENIVANKIDFESYCSEFDSQIDILKNDNTNNPFILPFLSELYLQRGILEYQNDNSFAAISYFSKAYSYWNNSEENNPNADYNLKLSGVFNLLIGNLPKPYSQMVSWFGYKGDPLKGFEDLQAYLNLQNEKNGDYFEALIYLGFSYLKFGRDENLIKKFVQLHSNTELPEFIQSIIVRCANKVHSPDLCIDILKRQANYPVLNYLKGKYFVQSGSDSATFYLEQFIDQCSSFEFEADAFRYLSWYQLVKGNVDRYWSYQDSILTLSEYNTSEDRQAKYEAEMKILPDLVLLKARMLFDSGRFKDSKLVLLSKNNYDSTQDQSEYHYRLGRCYQYLNEPDKALIHFAKAIFLGNKSVRYFAPYSALYAAQICFNRKDFTQCKYYLTKAEDLNQGEYKSSIKQEIEIINNQLAQVN